MMIYKLGLTRPHILNRERNSFTFLFRFVLCSLGVLDIHLACLLVVVLCFTAVCHGLKCYMCLDFVYAVFGLCVWPSCLSMPYGEVNPFL